MKNRFLILCFFISFGMLFHCPSVTAGSTKLISTGFDKTYESGPMESVMIVALARKPQSRKIFEETFAEAFQKYGAKTVISLDVIPQGEKVEKGLLKTQAEKLGTKYLFVVRLLGIKEKTEEVAIPIGRPGINLPGSRYDMPSLGIKETRVKLESHLYEVKTEKLIWSAVSESLDPKSTEEIANQLSGKVMKSLKGKKLLK